ncbi:hypothetical protein HQ533_01965 [Candidatus Woesearchaeota archaeon]|nr:hypothetical protein [Candidatus Woesearchaeota archaeon]
MKLPEHKHFFAVNGKKAENLSDLRDLIAEMPEKEFNHHVSGQNDFANWVRDILHRDYLADRMEKVTSKDDMVKLVNDEMIKDREENIQGVDEFKRFIAKEFIYGMIFGIIIGIIMSQLF